VIENHLVVLILLFIVAVLVRDDFVFTVVYLLAGAYIAGRWWSRQALRGLSAQREFVNRAFFGEEIPVRLHVRNASLLPVVWLRLQESVPVELAPPNPMQQVISLGRAARRILITQCDAQARFLYAGAAFRGYRRPVGPGR
jgi:hypothetical protein